jgi:hypothetical protein
MQHCLVFSTRHILTEYINTHYNSYTMFKHVCLFVFLALQPIVVVFSQPVSGL